MKNLPPHLIVIAKDLFANKTGFSGPEIISFFQRYNRSIKNYYEWDVIPSRHQIFIICLEQLNNDTQVDALLSLCEHYNSYGYKHGKPAHEVVESLKEELLLFFQETLMSDEIIKGNNSKTIRKHLKKCEDKLFKSDFDGLLTNGRSLIESIFKEILDNNNIVYDEKKDSLNDYYKKVANFLGILRNNKHPNGINEMLTGCISIINGISAIRNDAGDSHGRSEKKEVLITSIQAHFYFNIIKSISIFILQLYEEKAHHNDPRIIKMPQNTITWEE